MQYDREFIEKFYAGDENVFVPLFNQFRPRAERHLARWRFDASTIEEVLQEARVRFWVSRKKFDFSRGSDLGGYFHRILVNCACVTYRSRFITIGEAADELPAKEPSDASEMTATAVLMQTVASRLDENEQIVAEIISSAPDANECNGQIAERFGISIGAARARKSRVKAKLERLFSEEEAGDGGQAE